MNNTSKNMLLKRILAFALSFVMVVTSTPVAPLAYAEQDLNIDTAPVVISDEDLVQVDAENPTSDPAADDAADSDAPAAEQDAPSQEDAAPEKELALEQAPEVAAAAVDTAAAGPARVAPAQLQDNKSQEISSSNTAAGFKVIKYDKAGTYTLTVKDGVTFYGRIEISGGAKVTVNGKGTIIMATSKALSLLSRALRTAAKSVISPLTGLRSPTVQVRSSGIPPTMDPVTSVI